jgi:hypothetical protein
MPQFHVTYLDRAGRVQTGRVHADGSTPARARSAALASAAWRYGVARSRVTSAVRVSPPRAVTPYPEALTPDGGQ